MKIILIIFLAVCVQGLQAQKCAGDCQNGKGKMVYDDGHSYDGQWKEGKMDGVGTLVLANGIKYYGEFQTDNMHGYGVIYGADSKVIQSGIYDTNKQASSLAESAVLENLKNKESANTACAGDCLNGKGKMVYDDGHSYDGQWKGGKMDGIGTLVLAGGVKYYGEFQNDSMHGYGVVYGADSKVVQSGIYDTNKQASSLGESAVLDNINKKLTGATASNSNCAGDCQNGKGKFVYTDGNVYDGNWKNGLKHGYGILKLAAGAKYVGEFDSDNMHGYGIVYGNNGAYVQSGVYESNALKTSKSESEIQLILAKYK